MLTDPEIIDLYFERSEQAIKATDQKYGKYLSVIGYNILHDKYDSEECLSDTYFATWNRIPPERPNIFQIFLSRIMRNISISKYRKNTAKKRHGSELAASLEELSDCIVAEADYDSDVRIQRIAEILNSFLHNSDKRARFIFICRYYYSDSVKSIADMLGVSFKTVYRELESIREAIRIELEKEDIDI